MMTEPSGNRASGPGHVPTMSGVGPASVDVAHAVFGGGFAHEYSGDVATPVQPTEKTTARSIIVFMPPKMGCIERNRNTARLYSASPPLRR